MTKTEELQQLFNISAAHILQQGRPSLAGDNDTMLQGLCSYNGAGGLHCAAWPFIRNETKLYAIDPDLVQAGWERVCSEVARTREAPELFVDPIAYCHRAFVARLQSCHDIAALDSGNGKGEFMDLWKQQMTSIGRYLRLDLSILGVSV